MQAHSVSCWAIINVPISVNSLTVAFFRRLRGIDDGSRAGDVYGVDAGNSLENGNSQRKVRPFPTV